MGTEHNLHDGWCGSMGTELGRFVMFIVLLGPIFNQYHIHIVSRSVSIKTDVPTYNTDKYEDNSLTNGPSDNAIPNRVEEIELKESPSYYEILVPTKASLSQQAGYIDVNPCSAYGINTSSPNLEFGGQGQEGVEVTPSDGVYETIH